MFGRSKTGKFTVAFQYGLTLIRQQVAYGGNFGSDQEVSSPNFIVRMVVLRLSKTTLQGKKNIFFILEELLMRVISYF